MQERLPLSNRKTGVDVFQEEQKHENRGKLLRSRFLISLYLSDPHVWVSVKTLEDRLANLESSLEAIEQKASAGIFEELHHEQVNSRFLFKLHSKPHLFLTLKMYTGALIVQQSSLLEKQRKISVCFSPALRS